MGPSDSHPPYLLAAGGVVVRGSESDPSIAVVHRTRYTDRRGEAGDWVLPKGKLEKDEDLVDAALREVLEETGCRATVTGPASFAEHEVAGVPKVTAYFPMRFQEEVSTPSRDEVRSVHWLPFAQALERLTYDSERDVLTQVLRQREGRDTGS